MKYLRLGFSRDQVFHSRRRSRAIRHMSCARESGRSGTTYSYHVPGQWQGRTREPRVIGDSRAAGTVRRLAFEMHSVLKLRSTMGDIDLRFIEVVRNPYDVIATMMIRRRRTFESAFADYFGNWKACWTCRADSGPRS